MWFGLLCVVLATNPSWEARTVRGAAFKGKLADWTAKSLVLDTATGQENIPLDQLLDLLPGESLAAIEAPAPIQIALTDGSLLAAKSYAVREGQAVAELNLGKSLTFSTSMIAWVQLAGLSDAHAAEWARLLEQPHDGDLLVVRKGDALDYHRGLLRDVSAAEAIFEVDGERLPVKRAKVVGMVYYHPPGKQLPEAVCRLTDAGGSRYVVRALRLDAQQLAWTTPGGLAGAALQTAIRKIEFASQRVVYLSDLAPEVSTWTPFFAPDKELPLLDAFYRPRQDRGFGDDGLRLGKQTYRKGLALHSKSTLTYRLPDRFSYFKALLGIADAVRPRGWVHVVIQGDDRVLWEQNISGEEAPLELNLEIGGVRRLSLQVDFAAAPGAGDQVLFCEARVVQ